jgi:hypothetical protein
MAKLPASRKSNDSDCPHCHVPLTIASVEIGLTRVVTHSICPNCSLVLTKDPGKAKVKRRKPTALSFLRNLRLR